MVLWLTHVFPYYARQGVACKFAGQKSYNVCVQILENIPLKDHSTMRLGGTARYAVEVTSRQDVAEAAAWAESHNLPMLMIGTGSNIVWKDEGFSGLLLINNIKRFELFDEDGQNFYLTVGGGETWDEVVKRAVDESLTGIEALSLIPGTAGAAPVQNIGAYGQELADTLTTIEAYDVQTKQFVTIPGSDCNFGYRASRFKYADRGRFFITAITLHLTRGLPEPPFYKAVEDYLKEHSETRPTPQTIRDAVIAIRTSKLPDPKVIANNGSFFANPIVEESTVVQLLADYPDMPYWRVDANHVKIPAGWLVDQVGLKGYHDEETGMATWDLQALVFVNEHARRTADLLKFRQKITDAVQTKFGIALEQEPELLP